MKIEDPDTGPILAPDAMDRISHGLCDSLKLPQSLLNSSPCPNPSSADAIPFAIPNTVKNQTFPRMMKIAAQV